MGLRKGVDHYNVIKQNSIADVSIVETNLLEHICQCLQIDEMLIDAHELTDDTMLLSRPACAGLV